MRLTKKPLVFFAAAACLLWGAGVALAAINGSRMPDEIMFPVTTQEGNVVFVLHGKDALGGVIITAGILLAANLFLSNALWRRDDLLSLVLAGGTVLFALFTLVAIGAIVTIN